MCAATVPLFFQHYPTEQQRTTPLLVLHGLFGSNNNWRSVCQRLAARRDVYAPDLRNHGRSPHHTDMRYTTMAADIGEFIQQHNLAPCHVLGHSMGGKVAMQLALQQPDMVNSLIVVDIAPKNYPPRHADVFAAIDALDALSIQSRQQADQAIQTLLPDAATRAFLLSNLVRHENNLYAWRINTTAIRNGYNDISAAPTVENDDTQYSGPCLFVAGESSNYIRDEDHRLIKQWFPAAQIDTIPNTGHWLHVEAPEALISRLEMFLF